MKGIGTIVYLKDEGRYRAFFYHNGKRYSKRCNTSKEASDWLIQAAADIKNNVFCDPSNILFGDWVVEYLEKVVRPKVKDSTYLSYKTNAKKFGMLSGIPLQKITPLQVQTLVNSFTNSYKQTATTLLKMIFKKAVKMRLIQFNPADSVDNPSYHVQRKDIFNDTELAAIKREMSGHKYGDLYLALLASGCRVGELLALKINNVFPHYIHIDSTINHFQKVTPPKKRSSVRDVPLPESVIAMLRKNYNQGIPVINGFVFHDKDGEPLRYCTVKESWDRLLKRAGVPHRGLHYLRHTHATNLLHLFDIVEVQNRLGHANASTTLNSYGHVKQEYQPQIVAAVENMVK